jgi:hypothetical protein
MSFQGVPDVCQGRGHRVVVRAQRKLVDAKAFLEFAECVREFALLLVEVA